MHCSREWRTQSNARGAVNNAPAINAEHDKLAAPGLLFQSVSKPREPLVVAACRAGKRPHKETLLGGEFLFRYAAGFLALLRRQEVHGNGRAPAKPIEKVVSPHAEPSFLPNDPGCLLVNLPFAVQEAAGHLQALPELRRDVPHTLEELPFTRPPDAPQLGRGDAAPVPRRPSPGQLVLSQRGRLLWHCQGTPLPQVDQEGIRVAAFLPAPPPKKDKHEGTSGGNECVFGEGKRTSSGA